MLYGFNHSLSVTVILPVLSTVRSQHHVFFPSTVPDMLQFAHSLRLIVRATQLGVASFAVREALDEEQSSSQQATVRWNPPKNSHSQYQQSEFLWKTPQNCSNFRCGG